MQQKKIILGIRRSKAISKLVAISSDSKSDGFSIVANILGISKESLEKQIKTDVPNVQCYLPDAFPAIEYDNLDSHEKWKLWAYHMDKENYDAPEIATRFQEYEQQRIQKNYLESEMEEHRVSSDETMALL